MSAGDLLVQYDLAYERYSTPQPELLALALTRSPAGLTDPVGLRHPGSQYLLHRHPGRGRPWPPRPPALARPRWSPTPSPPRARSSGPSRPAGELVVDGDAAGLDDAGRPGLLDGNRAIYYAGTLDTHPTAQQAGPVQAGSTLVVTDTNRKQAFRWNTIMANAGATQTPAQNRPRPHRATAPSTSSRPLPWTRRRPPPPTWGRYTSPPPPTATPISYTPRRPALQRPGRQPGHRLGDRHLRGRSGRSVVAGHLASPPTTDHVTLVQPQSGSTTAGSPGSP